MEDRRTRGATWVLIYHHALGEHPYD
jgi:hypothetical protein